MMMFEDKKGFIEDLSKLFLKYNDNFGIDCMQYKCPGEHYHEEVNVYWKQGGCSHVNVSCDSYIGMLRDIMKGAF